MIVDTLKLDLHRQDNYPTIYAKQYDTLERKLVIELYDNGVLLKAIKVNELVTLTASINNEIVASKDILIVR